jgi:hypothetical protein
LRGFLFFDTVASLGSYVLSAALRPHRCIELPARVSRELEGESANDDDR